MTGTGNGKIFVSHASEDTERCQPLLQALASWNLDYWFDDHDLHAGMNIIDVIIRELEDRDIYLRVCTPAASRSFFVKKEHEMFVAQVAQDSKSNPQRTRTLINVIFPGYTITLFDRTNKYIETEGHTDDTWLSELHVALQDVSSPQEHAPAPTKEAYRSFFGRVAAKLASTHDWVVPSKISDRNWCSFSTGIPGFAYSTSFPSGGKIRTELYIGAEQAKAVFNRLLADKEIIEREFGESLTWEPLEYRKASRIAAYRPGTVQDTAHLAEYEEWVVDHLVRFKRVFGPRLAQVSQVVPVEVEARG